jgi:hypothetical protein
MDILENSKNDDNTRTNLISEIEEIFLIGKYARALTMCNRYLISELPKNEPQLRPAVVPSHTTASFNSSSHLLLRIPLHLQCDMTDQTRYVSIQWCVSQSSTTSSNQENENRSIHIQKVGAMALQSWYELSKQQQQQPSTMVRFQDDDGDAIGVRFFTSLSLLTSKTYHNKSMSMELFVIFIRFLSSSIVGQDVEAISLVVEFLRQLRSYQFSPTPEGECYNNVSTTDQTCGQEIIVYFFTEILPHSCNSVNYGNQILDYIKDGPSNVTIESLPTIISAMLQESKAAQHQGSKKEIIQLCLQYCNTDDGKWPKAEWINNAFCQSRKLLQRELNVMYYNNQQMSTRYSEEQNTNRIVHNEIVNVFHATEEQCTKWTDRCTLPPVQLFLSKPSKATFGETTIIEIICHYPA